MDELIPYCCLVGILWGIEVVIIQENACPVLKVNQHQTGLFSYQTAIMIGLDLDLCHFVTTLLLLLNWKKNYRIKLVCEF